MKRVSNGEKGGIKTASPADIRRNVELFLSAVNANGEKVSLKVAVIPRYESSLPFSLLRGS